MADAVVIPGGSFGPGAGLLMFASLVAQRRGAAVHRHWWSAQPSAAFEPEIEGWVCDELRPLLDSVGGTPLVIGKSLGSNAAMLAAERRLPAVWLTPVLTVPWVVAGLARASAPLLLVGGSADTLWDGAVARRLSSHVLEIADADHGLCVPGPVIGSIDVLGRVVTAIEAFLDAIDWPGQGG